MKALIFVNGCPGALEKVMARHRAGYRVYCADGGARYALKLGLKVDVLIGDLDSIASEQVTRLENEGTRCVRFPRDKDKTDLELAIELALTEGATDIVLLAALGGRLDHMMGNIMLCGKVAAGGRSISIEDEYCSVYFLTGGNSLSLEAPIDATVSLIPLTECEGVSITGFKWGLMNERLLAGSPRTISNEVVAEKQTVGLSEGWLVIIVNR